MTRLVLAACAGVLTLIAMWSGVNEYRAVLQNGLPAQALIRPVNGEAVSFVPASSLLARSEQMRACIREPLGPYYGFNTRDRRLAFAQSCQARATDILADQPSFALAHLAQATALSALGDRDGAVTSLAFSRATAPNEGWIATHRLLLALTLATSDDLTVLDAAAPDARVLASQAQLVPALVDAYVRFPAARDWFPDALESAPSADQRRFLSGVSAAQRRGLL